MYNHMQIVREQMDYDSKCVPQTCTHEFESQKGLGKWGTYLHGTAQHSTGQSL